MPPGDTTPPGAAPPPGGAEERRSQARVRAERAVELTAELLVGPGQSHATRVLDSSAGGVRLALPPGPAPRFYLGTRVELRFHQPGVARPLVAQGQIGNQSQHEGGPAIGVRFVEREAFYRQLTPELWRRFNRRRRSRMRFRTEPAFPARIVSAGRSWSPPITDLSPLGLGVEVDPLDSQALFALELVRVHLTLPDEVAQPDLVAVQVHATPFGHGVRHGLRFDPHQGPDLREHQARIAAFLERQYLLLRR